MCAVAIPVLAFSIAAEGRRRIKSDTDGPSEKKGLGAVEAVKGERQSDGEEHGGVKCSKWGETKNDPRGSRSKAPLGTSQSSTLSHHGQGRDCHCIEFFQLFVFPSCTAKMRSDSCPTQVLLQVHISTKVSQNSRSAASRAGRPAFPHLLNLRSTAPAYSSHASHLKAWAILYSSRAFICSKQKPTLTSSQERPRARQRWSSLVARWADRRYETRRGREEHPVPWRYRR